MNDFLSFIIGLLVRIAIPIGISAVAIYLLRRLDERWQRQANILPVLPVGEKPCWEMKNCSEAKRKDCPAARQPNLPCWQVFRSKDGLLREACLECAMFRQAKAPVHV